MARILPVLLLSVLSLHATSQTGFIALKKGNKTIQTFFPGNHITFRMNNDEWITGTIEKIEDSTFTFTQEIIRYYEIGTDTFRIYGYRFRPEEIAALPSKRQTFVYRNDKVVIQMGREPFVWLRNGFLLQAAGGSYIIENVVNDISNGHPPLKSEHLGGLGIAAGAFILGTILHIKFDPSYRLGKKFKLKFVSF